MHQPLIPPSGILAGSAVALVVGRFVKKAHLRIKEIKSIFNYMYDKKNFENQKFAMIGLIYRYGVKTNLIPEYERINAKYKDLPITVELDTLILDWADKNNPELLKEIYLIATCEAVLHVLHKYKLPTHPVDEIRAKLGTIPLTIEACQDWTQKTPVTPEAILGFTPDPWPSDSAE